MAKASTKYSLEPYRQEQLVIKNGHLFSSFGIKLTSVLDKLNDTVRLFTRISALNNRTNNQLLLRLFALNSAKLTALYNIFFKCLILNFISLPLSRTEVKLRIRKTQ